MTQTELARKSGIDQGLISRYLRGEKRAKVPSLKNLVKLTRALRCTLEDLTGEEVYRAIDRDPTLLPEAIEFEKLWNELDEDGRTAITTMMKSLAVSHKKRKESERGS